jgi:cob(I)alamin adenosyltransferase
MALFTRKGDDGKTSRFGCDQRFSKSSAIAEALGSLDEINSYLGFIKIASKKENIKTPNNESLFDIVSEIQQNLFIIQAQVAGADKIISAEKILQAEKIIERIEKELPPIKSFFVSGGTELSSLFDFARTIARRAERRVVAVVDEGKIEIDKNTMIYLNRLSSLLYALARLSNHLSGIKEESPNYK